MATRTRMTAEDLWKLGSGDVRRELIDGELVEMTPVGGVHGAVTVRVSLHLAAHVERAGTGWVVAGDVGFVLGLPRDLERVRAPDVAFISTGRLPGGQLPQGFVRGAPDLAVEVLSPNDDPVEIQQKIRDYLEAGSRLVWVVAPRAETVTVHRPDGSTHLVRESEPLDGEDVLPGFSVPVSELFK